MLAARGAIASSWKTQRRIRDRPRGRELLVEQSSMRAHPECRGYARAGGTGCSHFNREDLARQMVRLRSAAPGMSDLYAALLIFAQNWICGLVGRRRIRERFLRTSTTRCALERTIDARACARAGRPRRWCVHAHARVRPVLRGTAAAASRRSAEALALRSRRSRRSTRRPTAQRGTDARDELSAQASYVKTSGDRSRSTGRRENVSLSGTRWRGDSGVARVWRSTIRIHIRRQPIVPLRRCARPSGVTIDQADRRSSPAPPFARNLPRTWMPCTQRRWAGLSSALAFVAHAMLDAGRSLPRGRITAVFTSSRPCMTSAHMHGLRLAHRYTITSAEMAVAMTGCREGRLHVDMEFASSRSTC